MLATVSPNIVRYKEICKNGGEKLHMPTFELYELLSLGRYMLDKGVVPKDLIDLDTPANITQRFSIFGPIVRHVLPVSMKHLNRIGEEQSEVIMKADLSFLDRPGDIEDAGVSHYVLKYSVRRSASNSAKFDLTEVV